MNPFPMAERELRLASRRASTYGFRFLSALVAVAIALGFLAPSFSGFIDPAETGRAVFLAISALAMFGGLIAGVFLTADTISEERRAGSLGLLFLTRLTSFDVVMGKLTANSLNAIYALLAVFPIQALSLLLGGVPGGELWRMFIVLLNSLLFSLAVGMWVSSWSRDTRKAMASTLLLIVVVTIGPWLFLYVLDVSMTTQEAVLPFSPAFAAVLARDTYYAAAPGLFRQSIFITGSLTLLLLTLTTRAVRKAWRENPRPSRAERWSKFWLELERRWFARTGREDRVLLEARPVLWFATREQRRRIIPVSWLIFAIGIGTLGCLTLQSFWSRTELVFTALYVLNALFKLWIAAEVCRSVGDVRSDGTLETLLNTPLRGAEVLQGLLTGVKYRFLVPAILALVANLLWAGLSAGWFPSSLDEGVVVLMFLVMIAMLLADLYTLPLVGFWHGLTAPSPSRAILWTMIQTTLFPWLIVVGASGVLALQDGSPPGPGWLSMIWFVACYLTNGVLSILAIRRLGHDFRGIALRPPMAHPPKPFVWLRRSLDRFQRALRPQAPRPTSPRAASFVGRG